MKTLVVASENKGKLKEIREILGDRYEIISMRDAGFSGEILEDGATFYENALKKAKTVAETLKTDALADDSGLCVEALGGAPGVYSARYSGSHGDDKANRSALLKNLANEKNRRAKFVCNMVLYGANGEIVSGVGETYGNIGYEEEGGNGFGYDCVFISDDLKKCFGLASDEEKNAVSHRKRAIEDLLCKL